MRAVYDDYQPRTLDKLGEAVVRILQESSEPLRCGNIGSQLFPEAIHRGSAPFARLAGRVMRHLERAGRVRWGSVRENGQWGWYLVKTKPKTIGEATV